MAISIGKTLPAATPPVGNTPSQSGKQPDQTPTPTQPTHPAATVNISTEARIKVQLHVPASDIEHDGGSH
jgi:hypothetical protein